MVASPFSLRKSNMLRLKFYEFLHFYFPCSIVVSSLGVPLYTSRSYCEVWRKDYEIFVLRTMLGYTEPPNSNLHSHPRK